MNNDPHAHDVLTDDRFGAQVGRLLGPSALGFTRVSQFFGAVAGPWDGGTRQ